MPCYLCGRVQQDPSKAVPSPWARAVVGGRQVLVCPGCQRERSEWSGEAERCPACASIKVSIQVGFHVCRACGENWEAK